MTANTASRTQNRPPTSKDVAALAGVSQSTVSFVINGKYNVSESTRRKVQEAMRKLNYQPNAGARTLRTNKTNIISLFVEIHESLDANETTPYIDTIVAQARKHDYDVILSTTNEGSAGINRLAGKSICDAFILMDVQPDDERIPAAAALNMPVVLIGRPNDAMGLDVVDFDTREAARMAVRELAETGHRHVAIVGDAMVASQQGYKFVEDFYAGAADEASRSGLELSIVPRITGDWASFAATADQLLAHRDDRLGIIVRQPRMTEWVLRLLDQRRIVPGKDVSLIAHCADLAAKSFPYPVTNISTLPEQLSTAATDILFTRLEGDRSPAHTQLVRPAEVTRRATTVDWNTRD
ncbi:LacI family DNA-binding transcriptional regulator [Bifidobacterium oedipodis]|uniref:Transcriptional regulator n=1 Tax=Bifidobacterium oedipodis TaxID=2675322 RepID=A0A7Y0EQH5_9BIFI|nr:LacI family DNA-binding transcriptional regulator [Bifidobacterium sp. DSM 109957]NMM94557.1 transcriptional regulator [Bifidobacterium sp. DSM 109957]